MAESGLRYVRLGEFAWSRIEPDPGRYRFDWLDEAIDCLAEQGLEIVLCTPTAAPPKWLIDRYPEVLPHDPATGRPRGFGSRRHYDFSSERYLTEALRITEAVAGRYGEHPGVAGWQTDNELCCNDTTLSVSPRARAAFRAWCRQRYGTIEDLNEAWGNVFWSMEYRSFDQIEPPFGAVTQTNPAHQLAYRRFAADQVVRFHRRMIRSLRRLSPGRFITHNFIAMAGTQVDDFALAEGLDFASYDNYPLGHTDLAFDDLPKDRFSRMARTGHPDFATYVQDQTRGLTDGGFWIMEQQPGPVNWARHNPRPAPGMIRLWTLEAFAHGADCVSYFRWRQAPFAQEQMHAGLLRPDDSATPAMGEIRAVRSDIAHIGLRAGLPVPSDAAIVTSVESQWVCEIERQGRGFEFDRVQFQYYAALRALGLNVDFVSAKADLSPYKLIVIPCLPMVGGDRARGLRRASRMGPGRLSQPAVAGGARPRRGQGAGHLPGRERRRGAGGSHHLSGHSDLRRLPARPAARPLSGSVDQHVRAGREPALLPARGSLFPVQLRFGAARGRSARGRGNPAGLRASGSARGLRMAGGPGLTESPLRERPSTG